MPSQWPCLLVILVLCGVLVSIGAYYTMIHKKPLQLVSCFKLDGKCREFWNCDKSFQSREITTCINKRKVCCLKSSQVKNILDTEEYLE
ncbi:uncharacterized protein Dana_GF27267 [Drosophila ananassae]|uniref:Single domain-containing protein n=1 Tax=Drosophila ananassae TaxID=7217 RepID=A0A0P8XX19_DROAN|nr:uncharacterized protein LOC26514676 [Drosophila ananassae]KPU79310.1 uncharacterized protein Dana_GF27267 [Drosophila ananassae]